MRVKITLLDLLTTFLIIEAGMCLTYLAVRAHFWLIFNLMSAWIPDFFPQNCFIDNWPPAYTVAWVYSTQDEETCMCFYWTSRVFCELQPVQVPQKSSPALQQTDCFSWPGIVHKLAESALHSMCQSLNRRVGNCRWDVRLTCAQMWAEFYVQKAV